MASANLRLKFARRAPLLLPHSLVQQSQEHGTIIRVAPISGPCRRIVPLRVLSFPPGPLRPRPKRRGTRLLLRRTLRVPVRLLRLQLRLNPGGTSGEKGRAPPLVTELREAYGVRRQSAATTPLSAGRKPYEPSSRVRLPKAPSRFACRRTPSASRHIDGGHGPPLQGFQRRGRPEIGGSQAFPDSRSGAGRPQTSPNARPRK
jgi:hypothetical protein